MTELHAAARQAAHDAMTLAFENGGEEDAQMDAAITAYLAALPKAGKPARVDPRNNPHFRFYVAKRDGLSVAFHALRNIEPDDTHGRMRHGLDLLCGMTHSASRNAGWYTDPATGKPLDRNVPEMLMLIVSEIAEGMEGYRKGLMDDHLPNRLMIEVELADAVIRIGDLCGFLGLDLAGAVVEKMAYNAKREDHKPEVRAAGGKAF